jgi:hypothetical protein
VHADMAQRHHPPGQAGPDTVTIDVCDAGLDWAVEGAVLESSRADDEGWVEFVGVAEGGVG